jgi:hypothetical protein
VDSGFLELRRSGSYVVVRFLEDAQPGAEAPTRAVRTRRYAVADLQRGLRRQGDTLDVFATGAPVLRIDADGARRDTIRIDEASVFSGPAGLRFIVVGLKGDAAPADAAVRVRSTLPEDFEAGGAVLPLPEFRRFLAELRRLTGVAGAGSGSRGAAQGGAR